jgi:cell division septation protein DedD
MAVGNRKKRFSIKFELSPAGLLGVGVVCFCIFLWMFLLGVWAGQTVLTTGSYQIAGPVKDKPASSPVQVQEIKPTARLKPSVPEAAPLPATAKSEKTVPPPPPALAGEDDTSYFAVQVGAFREASHVEEALNDWRGKGYKPFSRPPEGPDDQYTRVYVGRFEEVIEARKQAEALERKEKIKPFIATIPAGSGNKP